MMLAARIAGGYRQESISVRRNGIRTRVMGAVDRHPAVSILLAVIIMPVLALAAVAVLTLAAMLPISFLLGWL